MALCWSSSKLGDLSDQSSSSMSYMPDMMQTIWCCSEPAKGIQPERRMYTMTPTLHLGRIKRLKRLGHSWNWLPKDGAVFCSRASNHTWSCRFCSAPAQVKIGCFRWEVYPRSTDGAQMMVPPGQCSPRCRKMPPSWCWAPRLCLGNGWETTIVRRENMTLWIMNGYEWGIVHCQVWVKRDQN